MLVEEAVTHIQPVNKPTETNLKDALFLRVSPHLFFDGLPLTGALCLGQQGAVQHRPAVLEERLDELELVVAKQQNQLVFAVSVITGILR